MNDKELLKLYYKGWNDELNQTVDKYNKSKAYLMGREDYSIGDEIESRDLLPNKDILINIRGSKIATIFQDPMTSLDPINTIGSQITEVIIKHQGKTAKEANEMALDYMENLQKQI